jgi:hypothetical protein
VGTSARAPRQAGVPFGAGEFSPLAISHTARTTSATARGTIKTPNPWPNMSSNGAARHRMAPTSPHTDSHREIRPFGGLDGATPMMRLRLSTTYVRGTASALPRGNREGIIFCPARDHADESERIGGTGFELVDLVAVGEDSISGTEDMPFSSEQDSTMPMCYHHAVLVVMLVEC